jgi:CheY-like chemotaxis protein
MREYQRIAPDQSKMILVVGTDDALETDLFYPLEQETPYHVYRVFSGTQALQFATKNQIDLLVLSSSLPDITAPALYDAVDKTRGQQPVPTILLNDTLSWKELEQRNIICLMQPIDRDHLLQTLDTLFLFPYCPIECA